MSLRDVARRGLAFVIHPTLPKFLVVGTCGFLIDAVLLIALVDGVGLGPLAGRAVSFSIAVVATWWLNRMWSFHHARSRRRLHELSRYVAVQLTGGTFNLLLYAAVVLTLPETPLALIAGLIVGSAGGLSLNYLGARLVAFNGGASEGTVEARGEGAGFR